MSVELTSLQLILKLQGTLTNALDLSTTFDSMLKDYTQTFGNGTGASQGNMWWTDQRTTDGTGEDLDFAGGVTSPFGVAITFTALKGLIIVASAANTGNVMLTRPANGLVVFLASGDGLAALKPGGLFVFTDPSAAGLTVTASTGDLLHVAASTGTVTYDVIVWGEA
jgi:hypothetical protein